MTILTPEQIKEIVEELDCGMICYYNKENNDLLFIPGPDNYSDIELDAWKDDLNKLRKHRSKYMVIAPPQSPDSFKIMVQFVDALADNSQLKVALHRILNGRKPLENLNLRLTTLATSDKSGLILKVKNFRSGLKMSLKILMMKKNKTFTLHNQNSIWTKI